MIRAEVYAGDSLKNFLNAKKFTRNLQVVNKWKRVLADTNAKTYIN